MKMCNAPCFYKNILDEYNQNVDELKELLKGNSSKIIKEIKLNMKECSENMEYENFFITILSCKWF